MSIAGVLPRGLPRRAAPRRVVQGARTSLSVYRALASEPQRARIAEAPALHSEPWQRLLAQAPRQRRGPAGAWRGRVDALALRTRFSDARVFAAQQPERPSARLLYALLEQARVEALGARLFPGMRQNLAVLALERWHRARPETVVRTADAWVDTVALLARVPLQAPLPAPAQRSLASGWRQWLSAAQADALEQLAARLDDQQAYARAARILIAAVLGPDSLQPAPLIPSPEPPAQQGKAQSPQPAEQPQPRPLAAVPASGDPLVWAEQGHTERRASISAMAQPSDYRVFSRVFDEVVEAASLCEPSVLVEHRRQLDALAAPHLRTLARWAHRLQRRLMALQVRRWQFDLEEGLLDAARLSRVVTQPLEPLAYKRESDTRFPDTVVTLLIDASGSMRGRPIATAAVCAELLGRALEHCGVRSEVLGYTTRAWRGGRARQQWLRAGRPANPGRLSELRHIVFKRADEPWRRARAGLGALLDEDLLKENIDGEALLWAQSRLMRRSEPRRILLVISDDAPMDESTAQANGGDYLEQHLRAVIGRIERDARIELAAIGIGHAVGSYYRRAVTIRGPEELGEAVVLQLFDMLQPAT